MTIEKLLSITTEELEAMSDSDLQRYFEPAIKLEKTLKTAKTPKQEKRTANAPKRNAKKQDLLSFIQSELKEINEKETNKDE